MGEGQVLLRGRDVKNSQKVFLDAYPLTGDRCLVESTHRQVMRCINMTKRELKLRGREAVHAVYRSIYTAIRETDVDLAYENAKAKTDTQQWRDYCADILLLATHRHVLFDKVINIIFTDGTTEVV